MTERMNEAERAINGAVLIKLFVLSMMALFLASEFSDMSMNFIRISGGQDLITVPAIMILDMILTLTWRRWQILYRIHLILTLVLGMFFYIGFLLTVFTYDGFAFLAAIVYSPLLLIFNVIPFIICHNGWKIRRRALSEQNAAVPEA